MSWTWLARLDKRDGLSEVAPELGIIRAFCFPGINIARLQYVQMQLRTLISVYFEVKLGEEELAKVEQAHVYISTVLIVQALEMAESIKEWHY